MVDLLSGMVVLPTARWILEYHAVSTAEVSSLDDGLLCIIGEILQVTERIDEPRLSFFDLDVNWQIQCLLNAGLVCRR